MQPYVLSRYQLAPQELISNIQTVTSLYDDYTQKHPLEYGLFIMNIGTKDDQSHPSNAYPSTHTHTHTHTLILHHIIVSN